MINIDTDIIASRIIERMGYHQLDCGPSCPQRDRHVAESKVELSTIIAEEIRRQCERE